MSKPLISTAQLAKIQKMGEAMMITDVYIYAKGHFAKDPSNPYGDDTVSFSPTPVIVKGWLVTNPTENVAQGGGQVRATSTHKVRVPVGTVILTGDKVVVDTETFIVTDATNEQSWPEWTVAFLRGYQGER